MNNERHIELFELNSKAWDGVDVLVSSGKKLDSSIKRNTGFIRKLKLGISKDSKSTFLKDITELSLEKYLSELVTTATEGLSRISGKAEDIDAAVEVVSALHQRFNYQFTPPLMESFLHNFSVVQTESESEKDEMVKMAKLKLHIRIFTELYLVGLFRNLDHLSKDNLPLFVSKRLSKKEPIIFSVLKEVLNYRFKTGMTAEIATLFITKFPEFFGEEEQYKPLNLQVDTKKLLQSLFKVFTEASIGQIVELNKSLNRLKREHQKAQIRTGKSTDEYIEEHDSLLPAFERFDSAIKVLAEAMHMDPPRLDQVSDQEPAAASSSIITNQMKLGSEKIWENEETRKFYEVLPDLSGVYKETEEKETADPSKLNEFFTGLELADTKEAIDDLSVKYWSDNLNKKATRRRILKFFVETQDWSKLRIYARFIAANAEFLTDTKDELIQYLDSGFRSQLRSNKINVKNIIFFSEMVKFMLIPTYLVFHKIRTLTMNIQVPNNIEILTILFESFGRFLINHPTYKDQMEKMADLIQQKKKEHDLSVSNKCALENLIVLIYPPSLSKLNSEVKELSPEQHFYRVLIRRELHTIPPERIVKLLRKAHWNDKQIVKTMFSLFVKPEKISYQSLDKLSTVLLGLYPYYRNFVIEVIDTLIENIERGLEINEFSLNMVRIAQIKYLTLLCNQNLVRYEVLLEVLLKILKFGYPDGRPSPSVLNEFDLPDNYFRVQLVTTALLGINVPSSNKIKKITTFMRFFEFYSFTKEQPLPKETQFRVTSAFDKLTNGATFKRSGDIVESARELASILNIPGSSSPSRQSREQDKEDEDEEEEDEDEDDEFDEDEDDFSRPEPEDDDDKDSISGDSSDDSDDSEYDSSNESGSDIDDDEDGEDDEEEDDDSVYSDGELERKRMQEEHMSKLRTEEELRAEEELEKQFQQLVQDSLESRKNEKLSGNSIPIISSGYSAELERKPSGGSSMLLTDNHEVKSKKVAFTFLSKSGKKTQARTLGLPRNVKFVSGVLEEEQKLKAEREKIKNIVLNQRFD